IGSYAAGISDDLTTATLLATRAPVVVCPAMHTEMWEHPAVQDNLAVLEARGVTIVAPEEGRLAGGDVGAGRLADPAVIVGAIEARLADGRLADVNVLVTAGGTREPIDPVRFIGNRSSGKQGYALAEAAVAEGAAVTLITTVDRPGAPQATTISVETAAEMCEAVMAAAATADVIIMAAAVADFRPTIASDEKIKKADGVPTLLLEPSTDILAELGRHRREGQILVGFAAETSDLRTNALSKLKRKDIDVVVANDVSEDGAGFGHDTNHVVIYASDGGEEDVAMASKGVVASRVLDTVVRLRSPAERAEQSPKESRE
ncbi:MAG: bifunctional phosphopantothenoylcysteine decarboxylase/phosphopantothenate--cysteine ligase CoaBC, partial [Acidimicrobiia bacterium]|nr:bifunctional phosphopantothenoylcysteine decarboxylase/phosphopantothenate--cysteine ligase CoaBC [Acidimicrobiia bacterium]